MGLKKWWKNEAAPALTSVSELFTGSNTDAVLDSTDGGGTTTTGEAAPTQKTLEPEQEKPSAIYEETTTTEFSEPPVIDLAGELEDIAKQEELAALKKKKMLPGITQQTMLNPLFMSR